MKASVFVVLATACALLGGTASHGGVEAAFPVGRWKKPDAYGEEGDIRPIHRKLQRQKFTDVEQSKHKTPGMEPLEGKRRSRSYHFAYGPIYPTHHKHKEAEQSFYPEDHMLYY